MRYALTSDSDYWTTLRPHDDFPVHLDCNTRLTSIGEQDWRCPDCDQQGGLLRPTLPSQSSHFHASLLEAASWRLASELTLRHPHLRIHKAFPHPGTSNVLMLAPVGYPSLVDQGPLIYLNTAPGGRIHVLKRSDGIEPEGGPWLWDEYLTAPDPNLFLSRIEDAAGLPDGSDDEPPPNEVRVYSLIAQLARLGMLGEPMSIGNGHIDQYGPAQWWPEMQERAPEPTAAAPHDPFGEPGYRFWRIERSGFCLTIETTTGTTWVGDYDPDEAEELGYDEGQFDLFEGPSAPSDHRVLQTALEIGEY